MASVKDMNNWGINISTCRRISEVDFLKLVSNGCSPQKGDVLIAKDGATCLETACEYRQEDSIVLLSSVAILRPKNIDWSSYLHTWLTLESTKQYLKEHFVSGSAIPRIVLKDIRRAAIIAPSNPVLKLYDRFCSALRNKIRENNLQSGILSELRSVLLPKLISGEIIATSDKEIL